MMKNGIKYLFALWIVAYLAGLIITLVMGFNGKRLITIEKRTQWGVVLLNEQKLKVNGTSTHADLPVHAASMLDYLLLDSKETGNFLCVLLKITLWVIALFILWRIDMSDPFDPRTLKAASHIGGLYIFILIANAIGAYYTAWWFNNLYHPAVGDFSYPSGGPGFFNFMFPLIIVSTILAFYRIAVYNQQQQDLTI